MAENSETSKAESANLLSQALGPMTGVLLPKDQIYLYSSQKILTEILAPLNSLKFYSLEKAPCQIGRSHPFPVEVRDSSDGVLFRFIARQSGQVVGDQHGGAHPIYMPVLIDPLQRELLQAKPVLGFAHEYDLTCKEGAGKQSLGTISIPSPFGCDSNYQVVAVNLFTGQVTGALMEVNGTSASCCCSSSEKFLFGCPQPNGPPIKGKLSGSMDPRVVGEMNRIADSISNNPNGTSQVNFDVNLPIVHKIWILFIAYDIHYRNFANTALSKNGQRGLSCACLHLIIWPPVVFMLLIMIILITVPVVLLTNKK